MVSVWIMVGLFLFVAVWASWMLAVERRAHNRTLDRLMALSGQMAAVMSEPDGSLGWVDQETGQFKPLVRSPHSGVEDVEGAMPGQGAFASKVPRSP